MREQRRLLGAGSSDTSMRHQTLPSTASSTASCTSSSSSSLVAKRKAEALFRRVQPHTLVQTSEKLLATLRPTPKLFIDAQELRPHAPPVSVAVAARASRSASTLTSKRPIPTATHWRFKPEAGRFHYALSLQYRPETSLSLSSLSSLNVTLASSAAPEPRSLLHGAKTWHLVAETDDRRVGLALYALPLGVWHSSVLLALVWSETQEVATLFLQLHTAELLHSAPERALQVRQDGELDRSHGLHAYTAAVTLRSLDALLWEHEVYDVEFPTPEAPCSSVTAALLDDVGGGSLAARDRVLATDTEPAVRVDTAAVSFAMRNVLLLDFTLWDAECTPVWGFSRALELIAASEDHQHAEDDSCDLSVSSLGDATQRLELRFQDDAHGNALCVRLRRRSPLSQPSKAGKKPRTWVAQIHVTLSLAFVNVTFGTTY